MKRQGRARQMGTGHRDLHLCNNYRHLLFALASIAGGGRPATVVYLEDDLPISKAIRTQLARACPKATFLFTSDRAEMAAFARLPKFLPPLLRRNLTLGGRFGLQRPMHWQPKLLAGQRFSRGYLYHSAFFFSKVVAGLCDEVVLRETGLNNYHAHPVPPLKGLVRFAAGLPARQQIWGEERWVDVIEVSITDNLPASVRGKARQVTFSDVMHTLPAKTAHDLASAFLADQPDLPTTEGDGALLLTQPLDGVNLCSTAEKQALYGRIVGHLRGLGYQVYVKHHPRDLPFALDGTIEIPTAFPIEAWPYVSQHRFDVAIALCSAALINGATAFARKTVQLLPTDAFNQAAVPGWDTEIAAALSGISPPQG